MKLLSTINIKAAVVYIKCSINSSKYLVVDAQGGCRLYDSNTREILYGFKTGIVTERHQGNTVAASSDLKVLAIAVPKTNMVEVYDLEKKTKILTAKRNSGEVESVLVSDDGKYLLCGGIDGKTFVFSLVTGKLAYSMPAHADFITAIAYSKTRSFVATGSFDKKITLTDRSTMKNPAGLNNNGSQIVYLKFISSTEILACDKEGNVIVYNTSSKKVQNRLEKLNDDIVSCDVSLDGKLLAVSTKLNQIAIYDLENKRTIDLNFRKESGAINSIAFLGLSMMLLGFKNGDIKVFKIIDGEQTYLDMVEKMEYHKFYAELSKNKLVSYTKAYSLFEKKWEIAVVDAKVFLEKGDSRNAKNTLIPFYVIPAMKSRGDSLISEFQEYSRFLHNIKNGKYPLAYTLANQYPSFKETKPYQELEQEWFSLLYKAQMVIMEPNGEAKAAVLLHGFRGIPIKSSTIQSLFKEKTVFNIFKKKVDDKKIKEAFALLEKHPFLKNLREFQTLTKIVDLLMVKALSLIEKGQYSVAKAILAQLEGDPLLKEEVRELVSGIRRKELLLDIIDKKSIAEVYRLAEEDVFMQELADYASIENIWLKKVDQCYTLAAKGDLVQINLLISDYLKVPQKKETVAKIVQAAYVSQIEKAVTSGLNEGKLTIVIERFLLLFGFTDEINLLVKIVEKIRKTTLGIDKNAKPKACFIPDMLMFDIVGGK